MKPINTKTHGYLDYFVGLLLIAAPWLLGFARNGAETWVPVILGIGTIVYSLITDYELGAARMISMRTHLALDFVAGLFLASSPWIFNFDKYIWQPHVIVGVAEMLIVLLTKTQPSTETSRDHSQRGHRTAAGQ
ncbi:MAG: SPW repeat protein [Chitinophagaceae bacterium]|nr:SPW repeat protein [Chitinophagaceae bacterium]